MNTVQRTRAIIDDNDKVTVHIGGRITERTARAVQKACAEAATKNCLLEVTIDSSGGFLGPGNTIRAALHAHGTHHDIRGVVTGRCNSTALLVLLAIPLDCRDTRKDAEFMAHCARARFGRRNKETRSVDRQQTAALARGSYMSEQDVASIMKSGADHYMNSGEALRLGIISRII